MTPETAARSHDDLYRAKEGMPEIVDVPAADFLMLDGHGNPNTSASYSGAIQALYSAAYGIKFALRRLGAPDERVAPLEGLWWGAEDLDFAAGSKDTWSWTLMIRLPAAAGADLVAEAMTEVARKKPDLPIADMRVERFREGPAAQVMHIGPYAGEQPTIEALHAFIAELGRHRRGKHHEIYLGDPRRSAPEKLRTLIRQPIT